MVSCWSSETTLNSTTKLSAIVNINFTSGFSDIGLSDFHQKQNHISRESTMMTSLVKIGGGLRSVERSTISCDRLTDWLMTHRQWFYYRATACNATHDIAVVFCPSVCLSVTGVDCDKIKQCTADILIPHEIAITLVFWHQQWLVDDTPVRLKFALKVTHPLQKTPTSIDSRL